MKKQLLDVLACPICKKHPLTLHIFEEEKEIVEGIMMCDNCNRWYPIIEEIPYMLPDKLRDKRDDLTFMRKWRESFPISIMEKGKPFNKNNL